MAKKPEILESNVVASSRLFRVESLHLRFSNGIERHFERLKTSGRGAVMVAPILNGETLVLIKEYAAGIHDYELTFPKGLIDPGETPLEAANRELKEEAGYGARELTVVTSLATAPGYMGSRMTIILAQDLYEERLPGDEPEEIEVVHWPLDRFNELFHRDDVNDARTIAALYMVRDVYQGMEA